MKALLILNEKYHDSVRAVDIANELGFSKPSVSRAMSILKEDGYVISDERGYLSLSEKGMNITKKVYEKHSVFLRLFKDYAQVDNKTAELDACKIEHVISDETYEGIKKFLDKNR